MSDIEYYKCGDYYLPALKLPEQETAITLGRWGITHRNWLKKHKPILYTLLLTSGKLMQHCKDIESTATSRLELIVKQMAKNEGITERLKETNQMAWVGAMNSIRNRAEEIIRNELICL